MVAGRRGRVEPQPLARRFAAIPLERHAKTANQNRGRDVSKEQYDLPGFHFSNPRDPEML